MQSCGTLGNKIDAFTNRELKSAISGGGPGIDDEEADEPPDVIPGPLYLMMQH